MEYGHCARCGVKKSSPVTVVREERAELGAVVAVRGPRASVELSTSPPIHARLFQNGTGVSFCVVVFPPSGWDPSH